MTESLKRQIIQIKKDLDPTPERSPLRVAFHISTIFINEGETCEEALERVRASGQTHIDENGTEWWVVGPPLTGDV